jgi:hypothetical protein
MKANIFWVGFGLLLIGMYGFGNRFSEPVETALAIGIFSAGMAWGRRGKNAC